MAAPCFSTPVLSEWCAPPLQVWFRQTHRYQPGGSPTARSTDPGERVFASLAVGNGSEMNEESLLQTQTPGKDSEDCPGTPVTAPCQCPDYYRSPVIINLTARGAARVSVAAG